MSEIKVGDVVAWADVPDGALVRENDGNAYALKLPAWALWIHIPPHASWWPATQERWNPAQVRGSVTIVALGLAGEESAADLQRLAEVFEVREALLADEVLWSVAHEMCMRHGTTKSGAEHLYAAGWCPGMSAEDAARLLAGGP